MSDDFLSHIASAVQLLPKSSPDLARLASLPEIDSAPRLAVFGNYNQGKSTLLNALIGREVFTSSDARETTEVSELEHDGVIWIDTPGLGADVSEEDDRKAQQIWSIKSADIVCLVHSVESGELDRREISIYRQINSQDHSPRAKIILVLTCIDQANSPEDIDAVSALIRKQLNEIGLHDTRIFPLSALRYQRGTDERKASFVAASGVPEFLSLLEHVKIDIAELRKNEVRRLIRSARQNILTEMERARKKLTGEQHAYVQRERRFEREILKENRTLIERAEKDAVAIPGTMDTYGEHT